MGQAGVLGDGARVHVEPAAAADEVEDAAPEAEDTEVAPTFMAAPTEGFAFAANVAVPDFR